MSLSSVRMDTSDDMDELKSARGDALAMLGRSELSRHQLTGKMSRKGHKPEVVTAVITSLIEKGLQSDERCADVLTREHVLRGHGPIRIRHDLSQRGLNEELITNCLQSDEYDFIQRAREIRHRRYGVALPADRASREKQRAFLYRRGFTPEQIQAAMTADETEE